jgi:hypothetical protein
MDDARDEFGLPRRWTFFDEDFDERIALTEAFVEKAVAAVLRQVDDRKTAERMFRAALVRQTAKPKGRPPKQKVNDDLREQVTRKVMQGEAKNKTAAIRAVAETIAPPEQTDDDKVDLAERKIYRAFKYAKRAEEAAEKARREWAAMIAPGADFDTALAEYHRRLGSSFLSEGD